MSETCMSLTASGLLRALIERCGAAKDEVLLHEVNTAPWRSLTFTGERHRVFLHLPEAAADRLCSGLEDAEFDIPGCIIADIFARNRRPEDGGSATVEIEALTINE